MEREKLSGLIKLCKISALVGMFTGLTSLGISTYNSFKGNKRSVRQERVNRQYEEARAKSIPYLMFGAAASTTSCFLMIATLEKRKKN